MSKKEENTQEVQERQEVQDVTSNNGFEWDSFILQNAEESQQLLHRVAEHYGIENEEEASLKMAFNMLYENIAQSPVSESVKEAFKGLENATDHLDRALEGLTGQSFNDFTSGALREISDDPENTAANISTAMEQLSSFIHSNAYNGLLSAINEIQSFIEAHKDNVIEQAKEFSDLVPYIRMVIDAEYPGTTFEDFIKEYQAFGDSNETIKEILAKAEAKQAEYLNGVQAVEAIENLSFLNTQYLPVLKSEATNLLPYINKKRAKINPRAHTATFNMEGATIQVKDYEKYLSDLGIQTDKLLQYGIAIFTHFNNRDSHNINLSVTLDLKNYALLAKRDTTPKDDTPKEKKRAYKQMEKLQEEVNKNLNLLTVMPISCKAKGYTKKDPHNLKLVNIISSREPIKKNTVTFTFTPEFAAFLLQENTIGHYPAKLLSWDNRKPTPYKIARKLFDYSLIDKNIIRGTDNIISVKKLLPCSGLPSFEEVEEKDQGHWIDRIKDRFENALNELVKENILEDWEYTHEKKRPLTKEERANISTNYYNFESLYICFTIANQLDQGERIEAKQKRIEAAKERKERRKQDAINRNIEEKANKEKAGQ
jgi:predicted Zn-ribbon and HTH transcriptional regulator